MRDIKRLWDKLEELMSTRVVKFCPGATDGQRPARIITSSAIGDFFGGMMIILLLGENTDVQILMIFWGTMMIPADFHMVRHFRPAEEWWRVALLRSILQVFSREPATNMHPLSQSLAKAFTG